MCVLIQNCSINNFYSKCLNKRVKCSSIINSSIILEINGFLEPTPSVEKNINYVSLMIDIPLIGARNKWSLLSQVVTHNSHTHTKQNKQNIYDAKLQFALWCIEPDALQCMRWIFKKWRQLFYRIVNETMNSVRIIPTKLLWVWFTLNQQHVVLCSNNWFKNMHWF